MARQAVTLLEERIETRDLPPVVTLLPGSLMLRQSARIATA
jgi:DNA-binding LacI/PurR family transcriptional regulator